MKIKLVSTKAINIELTPCEVDDESSNKEIDFSFDFNPFLPENEVEIKSFIIAFLGEMKSYKEAFACKVVFVAQFETGEIIDQEFLKNKFALINAPAIGYPYFRAFFSNLLLNAGYEPTFLPTINFVNLKEKKEKELSEQ
ncbi:MULTISPECIES: protein-export chaperone SecB [Acinetobacter]|uniref:protein-export chaperone SecB n=1 Tax=Acinetobacter TaxID=469 RepID=UPI0014212D99|nr:protein-export chaperone SecB [Acinetobacter sp. Tr-809]NIE97437.1 hypothetical protein [Acinetobacter sp. Tr-809]